MNRHWQCIGDPPVRAASDPLDCEGAPLHVGDRFHRPFNRHYHVSIDDLLSDRMTGVVTKISDGGEVFGARLDTGEETVPVFGSSVRRGDRHEKEIHAARDEFQMKALLGGYGLGGFNLYDFDTVDEINEWVEARRREAIRKQGNF